MTEGTLHLEKQPDQPGSANLVFTSAGDRANLHHWLRGRRDFDLWVSYYGDQPGRYRDVSDYYMARKGAKFPALHEAHTRWPDLFKKYEAIYASDDDLIISGSEITRLFEIRRRYDLWLVQPAFDRRGKNSHPELRVLPWRLMRYVNFIEECVPLFRRDKLEEFLAVYDPSHVANGVDRWYAHELLGDRPDKAAVIDAVLCINPTDASKGGRREIDQLVDLSERKRKWREIRDQRNIPESPIRLYETIWAPPTLRTLAHAIRLSWIKQKTKWAKSIRKRLPTRGDAPQP